MSSPKQTKQCFVCFALKRSSEMAPRLSISGVQEAPAVGAVEKRNAGAMVPMLAPTFPTPHLNIKRLEWIYIAQHTTCDRTCTNCMREWPKNHKKHEPKVCSRKHIQFSVLFHEHSVRGWNGGQRVPVPGDSS